MIFKRFRSLRRFALLMAALPLLQGMGACQTAIGQVLGNTVDLLPAITYNAAQSTFLLPYQIGLALLTGGFGGSTTGGGGFGGTGTTGIGGTGTTGIGGTGLGGTGSTGI